MSTRDLTPEELRYANRDVLADHLAKVQAERAQLQAEVDQLKATQKSAAPRLERIRTDDNRYRVLREGVGAGSLTYDPYVEVLDASWLSARDPRVGVSAAGIAAGILDQHGEEALWEHLELLAHQLSDQEAVGARG
jgi:hypothetical protein